jgi:dihydrofolate reductase
MRKLVVFNQATMDGYFTDEHGDMSWAHKDRQDAEWIAFVAGNANPGGVLLFGRITYDLMASFWPTPDAMKSLPAVAKAMNDSDKLVFSRTLKNSSGKIPGW